MAYRPTEAAPFVVLVVEDYPLIRMSAVDLVEEAGFIAIEAANADEAMSCLGQKTEISALFTDVDMPGSMDGLELAQTISRSRPDIRVIIGSGHRKVAPEDLPRGALFFSKPYDLPRLTEALKKLVS